MAQPSPMRPPGRPKHEGKRAAIINAARSLFTGGAYEAITMEQVANAAGVAKMTVYSHFQDKETLFEAVVRATSDRMVAALPALTDQGGDVEEELVAFGCAFLTILLSPEVNNSTHRHIDMLGRNRAVAERIYNAGPGRTRATLAAYLSGRVRPKLSAEECTDAASDLMSLWLGDLPQQLALGLISPMTQDAIVQRARRCTRFFLRATNSCVRR